MKWSKAITYIGMMPMLLVLVQCSADRMKECLKASGKPSQRQFALEAFEKVELGQHLSLTIEEAPEYEMTVRGGANLLEEMEVTLVDGLLKIENKVDCYTFRSYNQLQVHLKTPVLKEIRSKTSYHIRSKGVVRFPVLKILAEDFATGYADSATDVSIDLHIENQSFTVVTNGLANVVLRGSTQQCHISVAAADARIDARELVAQNVKVFHRGSNDILVHPVELLEAELRSTGNLLVYEQPITQKIVQLYSGRLIFVD